MYRGTTLVARQTGNGWFNTRPRQPQERHPLGHRPPQALLATFKDHLSELFENENSVLISDEDYGDELMVTGSQVAPKPPVLIDVNKSAYGGPLVLKSGFDVELVDQSFMRIVEYLPNSPYGSCVKGYRLLLQNHWELLMPERHHELVQLVKADNDLNVEYALSTIPAALVVRNCKIIFTSQQYKALNYRKDVQGYGLEDPDKPIFFCRWISADKNVGTEDGDPNGPPVAGRIEHLRFLNTDNGALITRNREQIEFRIRDQDVRKLWRGVRNCMLGGSHIEDNHGIRKQKYTFGDAFCGAGGTSSGALSAGLKMQFGFDLDTLATETYETNFGHTGTQILQMDVFDFIRTAALSNTYLVDFLHLSPPCQPFCGANRTPNPEDDKRNLAAFARVTDLLEVCKPRIATLEEAKSLTDIDKRTFFRMLICYFIKKGYSVQWKALELNRFGVPQTRKRTIIIASGPGEKLPPFLRPTHGDAPGLKEPPTIGATLNAIPFDAIHSNEVSQMKTVKPAYPEDKLCPTILTKPKSYHYHPSGLRRFSTRELAALQTFAHCFIFAGGPADRLRQIGNAVPPLFAGEMFRHLKTELRAADEAEASEYGV